MEKKTFVEKVGEAHMPRLIELFLQNETFGKPLLIEIVEMMPEAEFTLGRLVGMRRVHDFEIKTQKILYLTLFKQVPPVGETNLVVVDPRQVELARLVAGFTEEDLPPLKQGDRYAEIRRKEAISLVFGNGEIHEPQLRYVVKRLGIGPFLESEGYPKDIAHLVEQFRAGAH